MALLSHYRAAMAKTSSGELGGFDRVFKYLILFVQALIRLNREEERSIGYVCVAAIMATRLTEEKVCVDAIFYRLY